ncbi:DUF977 family protein [Candidatus Kaiserbacteria bacterium]|nr:MAG: DUF977 family protein [Candidatus Kaiserbacteria bacterium]
MAPFSLFALIAALAAFAVGFFVGKGRNQQNAGRFADSEEASIAGEKGRATVQKHIQKRKERILDSALRRGRITNDDVEDLFCVSDSTARNYLNELEEEGHLAQHGESGRGVFYTPIK